MMYWIMSMSLLLVMIIYSLFLLVFYKMLMDMENISSYECGYDPSSMTRVSFSFRFFLISILFIIFDVEISLMLPIPFLMSSILGLWIFNMFIFILISGLIYEYYYGSLNWLDNFIMKIL